MAMSIGHIFCNDAMAKAAKMGGGAESYVHVINDVITVYTNDRVNDVYALYISVFGQLFTKSYQTPTSVNGFIDMVMKEMVPKNVYQTMTRQQKADSMTYLHRELMTAAHSIAVANAGKIYSTKASNREALITNLFVDSLCAIGRATKQNFQATLYKPIENVGESHQLTALQEELKRVLMENVKLTDKVKSRDEVISKSIKNIKHLEADLKEARATIAELRREIDEKPADFTIGGDDIESSYYESPPSQPKTSEIEFMNASDQLSNILDGFGS